MINRLVHSMKLSVLLPGIIALWATACCLAHGSAILLYVGLQVLTTGFFALQMYRVEKSLTASPKAKPAFVPQAVATIAEHEVIAPQFAEREVAEHEVATPEEVLVGAT